MLSPFKRSILSFSRAPFRTLFRLAIICLCLQWVVAAPAHADKWALLIGIDEYADKNRINNLNAAATDARALKAALVEVAGFPEQNVTLLASDADVKNGESKPERSNIYHALAVLADKVKPGDTVFVLYSGHGIDTGDESYLLPYDTNASDPQSLTESAIATSVFRKRLEAVHAGTLILAFDMCRTNPEKGAKSVLDSNKMTPRQVRGLNMQSVAASGGGGSANKPVVVTLYACCPGQMSYEWAEKQRGYFSYFLSEGLRGNAADRDGTVKLGSLIKYVSANVEATVKRDQAGDQSPYVDYNGAAAQETDLVLATGVSPVAPPVLTKAVDGAVVETMATFRLSVSPTSAAVSIDGVPVTEKPAKVDLGVDKTRTVLLHVEAPGCRSEDRHVTIARGFNSPIVVMLEGSDAAISAASSAATPSQGSGIAAADAGEDMTSQLKVVWDGGALAKPLHDADSLTVKVLAVASADWRVRATYRTTTLVEGASYEIRFRARADTPSDITVSCAAANDGHNIGLSKSVSVSTEWQQYNVPFHATRISRSANFAPMFSLGNHVGTIQIANFSLVCAAN